MLDTPRDYARAHDECSDPARLIELLYQRALRDLKTAAEAGPDMGRSPAIAELLGHVQAIVKQLRASLDYVQGGYLAYNLGRVYEYMQLRLTEVISGEADDPQARIGEVIALLEGLSDAWNTMSNTCADGPAARTLVRQGTLVA
jgi:flagellar protein FliS